MELAGIADQIELYGTMYGMRIIGALLIFIVGRWVIKAMRAILVKLMAKYEVDSTLAGFISNISYYALLAFIIVAALNQLGIQTTSFIAVLGAAGLAIGLALQGSLSNFAAGFLIILFKPFRAGDFIEGGGATGVVDDVQIFTTTIKTGDNKKVIVPNSRILGGNIVNYTTLGTRRVDLVFGISYDDDIDKARGVILDIINADERVHKEPGPVVVVSELGDSAVNLTLRVWADSGNYWGVYFDTIETVKKRFDAEDISFPYPQQDVHMYQQQ
jgi:small conductance mechanosensitive channel